MTIILEKASLHDYKEIYALQIQSFRALLDRYQDYDYSPGAEKIERTIQRLEEPETDYYFISLNGKHIGALQICNYGKLSKLKQIFIIPTYQGYGYAQQAISAVERLYPNAEHWELDTILQEEKLCYLYEKMGYQRTGKTHRIKDGMGLVFYRK